MTKVTPSYVTHLSHFVLSSPSPEHRLQRTMAFLSLQRGLTSSILPQINTFTRTLVTKVVTRPVPPLRDPNTLPPTVPRFPGMDVIRGPQDFLKAIGREADTKVTAESWEELWKLNGQAMRKAGLSVRDRRYVDVFVWDCGPSSVPKPDRRSTGIFYGVWRNTAAGSQYRSSRMTQHRRRQYEGESLASNVVVVKRA